MLMRWDIINHFIKKNGYKDYLEIGYYKGWSFDRVESSFKTAVDPNPSKSPEMEEKVHGTTFVTEVCNKDEEIISCFNLFKLTSDEFFAQITPSTKWDIIFIDGLHEANQVFRDAYNASHHLNKDGIIIFHDCNPPLYEHTTTGIDGCWTGDTYAAAKLIKWLDGDFYTVATDWGVGIWKPRGPLNISAIPGITTDKDTWKDFQENRKERINLITVDEFLNKQTI